jgi:hypothetical protein
VKNIPKTQKILKIWSREKPLIKPYTKQLIGGIITRAAGNSFDARSSNNLYNSFE